MAARIKKGDTVVAIAGRDKGSRGRVLKAVAGGERYLVEGINMVRRHVKPNSDPKHPEGGIIEMESSIHASNIMLWDEKAQAPTRVKSGTDADGKKVRVSVKSGDVLGA